METILESKGLSKSYPISKGNDQKILKDINLQIKKGEFVSLMGPSGSGKSTLLYNISGMDKLNSGSVFFEEKDISQLSDDQSSKLRLHKMGFVFQNIYLLRNLTILDNIILPAYLAKTKPRNIINTTAKALMKSMGIAHLADSYINQASGGELQRAAICRSLINKPSILFGDEPTGALNSKAASTIIDIFTDINRKGTTIIIATHDPRVAAKTERILYLYDGIICAEKYLGKFVNDPSQIREREKILSDWLVNLNF